MDFKNIFKRYELKYLITKREQRALLNHMNKYMTPDNFGKSIINNVYFDTPNKLLVRRSLEKPCYKEKLRVRSYGVASENSQVFVEIKKKFDGVVYKRRIGMTERTATDYLINHSPFDTETQISREIDYFLKLYEVEPSVFLSYEREAFFGNDDDDFRMTFDANIIMRDYDLSLTRGVYGERILPSDIVLLEVKTAQSIPRWLLDFFGESRIYQASFSKYGTAYTQVLLPKFLGDIKFAELLGGNKYVA